MPPPVFVGFRITCQSPSPPVHPTGRVCPSTPGALSRALSPSSPEEAARREGYLTKRIDTYDDVDEGWDSDDDAEDDDETLAGVCVPSPRWGGSPAGSTVTGIHRAMILALPRLLTWRVVAAVAHAS
jgi:hypothetical protein